MVVRIGHGTGTVAFRFGYRHFTSVPPSSLYKGTADGIGRIGLSCSPHGGCQPPDIMPSEVVRMWGGGGP